VLAAVIEKLCLLWRANQTARKRARFNTSIFVELTKLRHRLLNDPTTNANAAHKTPITVGLPILLANRMAQIHAPSETRSQLKKTPKVGTTRSNHPCATPNQLI
jgi:hypothetical protein